MQIVANQLVAVQVGDIAGGDVGDAGWRLNGQRRRHTGRVDLGRCGGRRIPGPAARLSVEHSQFVIDRLVLVLDLMLFLRCQIPQNAVDR